MAIVHIELPHHQYAVHIVPGLLDSLGQHVRDVAKHDRAALLCDGSVAQKFAPLAKQSLEAAGYNVAQHVLTPGEDRKTLETVRSLYDILVDDRFERTSPIIALGGGVTGDTVGFVASTYLRGVPLIQCPTTLLAMVDASVGGKVGVNLPQGKNLIGAFYQPRLVAIDPLVLTTLPQRELRCGLAECVKHGIIRDADLFAWIESNLHAIASLDIRTMVELVRRNVQIKADVVMADEKESGERAHLNFGHTFAHAIEAMSGYGHYHHGEAVSLGMVAATRLAVDAGRIDSAMHERVVKLLQAIGLPTHAGDLAPTRDLLDAMQLDKKVADGCVHLVVPDRMGAVSMVHDVAEGAIAAAWDSLRG